MKAFQFHAELLEHRGTALQILMDREYAWLVDFGSVDVMHDLYGLEICAIRERRDARHIARLMMAAFPAWKNVRTYYEDHNGGEFGWKVIISREAETWDDCWKRK